MEVQLTLFYDTSMKMKLLADRLVSVQKSLYGFIEKARMLEGTISLLVLVEIASKQFSMMVDFLVVKVPFAYNAILGRLSLRMSQTMVSKY